MEELEIKKKIKEQYQDINNIDVEDMYQTLKENNKIPKNEKELIKLFKNIEKIIELSAIDDSNDN